MSKAYLFNGPQMQTLKDDMTKVQKIMLQAYTDGNAVKDKVDSKEHWQGEAQLTIAGFLDILMQYHKDLVENEEPIVKAEKSLQEFLDNLENFAEGWEERKELKNIV